MIVERDRILAAVSPLRIYFILIKSLKFVLPGHKVEKAEEVVQTCLGAYYRRMLPKVSLPGRVWSGNLLWPWAPQVSNIVHSSHVTLPLGIRTVNLQYKTPKMSCLSVHEMYYPFACTYCEYLFENKDNEVTLKSPIVKELCQTHDFPFSGHFFQLESPPQFPRPSQFCHIRFQLPHEPNPEGISTSADNSSPLCLFYGLYHIPRSVTLLKSYWSSYTEIHSRKRPGFSHLCHPSPNLASIRYRMKVW